MSDIPSPTIKSENEITQGSLLSKLKDIIGKDVDSLRISIPMFLIHPESNLPFLSRLHNIEKILNPSTDKMTRFTESLSAFLSQLKNGLEKSKKPLNPILGEVYRTHFTCPDEQAVYVVAEQVSHHPPISIFTCFSEDKRTIATTMFDTKASFTGMHFSLKNDSKAHLKRIMTIDGVDVEENYYCKFPDANVTGILSGSFQLEWTEHFLFWSPELGLKAVIKFENGWFSKPKVEGWIYRIADTFETTSKGSKDSLKSLKKSLKNIHLEGPGLEPIDLAPEDILYTIWGSYHDDICATNFDKSSTIILYSVQDTGKYTQELPRNPSIEEMVTFNENFEDIMKKVYTEQENWTFDDIKSDKLLPYESQVLWFAVTQSVLKEDTNKASDWKVFIEERQRQLRKQYEDENYTCRFYTRTDTWLPYTFKLPQ